MSKSRLKTKDQLLLVAEAAGRCQYPGCNKRLTKDQLTATSGNFSAFAHIVADSPEGPRGDRLLSPKLAKDPTNFILLCLDHHKLIDVEDVASHPVNRLHEFKNKHVERIRYFTEIVDEVDSMVVLLKGMIGDRVAKIDECEWKSACFPRYPRDILSADMTHLRSGDGDPNFVTTALREIDHLANELRSKLRGDKFNAIDVFALAPIPQLIYLGYRIGDIANIYVHQKHREPVGWKFPNSAFQEFHLSETSGNFAGKIVLLLNVSGANTVAETLLPDAPAFEIRVPTPQTDTVSSFEQLSRFRALVRQVLGEITNRYGNDVEVHVFPALPNSLAVEFGRVILPKADPNLVIYDKRGEWQRYLTIERYQSI